MEKMSEKRYLELMTPTEEDFRSSAQRITDGLQAEFGSVAVPVQTLRKLYPLCQSAQWKVTASLAWNGSGWSLTNVEAGDTTGIHYGLAVDLGSTTVVMEVVDLNSGDVVASKTAVNGQVAYGNEILSRIFASHEHPEILDELRLATVNTIQSLVEDLSGQLGYDLNNVAMMVISGNTTMIHFLIGLDAFTVFMTPYATVTTNPGFYLPEIWGLRFPAWSTSYPANPIMWAAISPAALWRWGWCVRKGSTSFWISAPMANC